MKREVVWLSAGVSSFIAGYLLRDEVTDWIYIDIADQHPDSIRFIKDVEKAVGKKVEILKSDRFSCVEDVIRKYRFFNSPYGAPCTGMLKKAVRKYWENEHAGDELTYIWGFDKSEQRRADGIVKNFPEFHHRFPLIEKGLSKSDCHALLAQLGIKRPLMYDLGFSNNNCIGCVKGGMGYWNHIRTEFPDVFEKRAKLEREIGHTCLNGVYLDELDPSAGKKNEVMEECSIMCFLTSMEDNSFSKAS